jgi:formate hydrogenlyase subunit 3/multisubunit Na+/H+ antiporter MnhD subunit
VSGVLLTATFAVPLAMLAACLRPSVRARIAGWLWLAPLPGLAAALLAHDAAPVVVDEAGLRFTLALDPSGAILLGVAALLWMTAGAYAARSLLDDPKAARFAEWWLPTLAGSLGVFVTADLFGFYVAFALASLPAWGLVVHDETARARRAGAIYLALAVVAEICLLLAFALLAAEAPGDTLAVRDVVASLPGAPGRHFTIALLLAGFGLKAGLVPLHVWLPLAHPAAPAPASAVLSGAIVKAGVIGLVRFLPPDPALAGWGAMLVAGGLFTAFYAVAVGVTQANPKTVLAYSTVSQMGGVAAILGMGLATGDSAAVPAATLVAAHHALVKGALFLAAGVTAAASARSVWVGGPALVLSLALGGLPLTGGAVAKLAAKGPMGEGWAATLATLSAAATTLLMLHFLRRLDAARPREGPPRAPAGLLAPWLAAAAGALAVPWLLAPTLTGVGVADTLTPAALWAAAWPIGLGALGVLALARIARVLPAIPEGDVLVLGAGAGAAARRCADALARADTRLREWPVAGVALLTVALALGAALLSRP